MALETEREDERLRYLTKIQTSSQLLLRIVNDVLDFSKLDAGKVSIVEMPFCLDEVFASLHDLLELQATRQQIELVFRIGADVPDLLVGDLLRLSQILLNLASNAIKFTNAGSVTLTVEAIEVRPDFVELRFDTIDTGIGLSEAQLPTLFDAFTQARRFDEREYGGTGLGLAICQRLTTAMGGKISVTSQVGRGSCFSVCLGFARAGDERETLPTASRMHAVRDLSLLPIPELCERWRGKRALTIDASPASGDAIAAMLAGFGLDVTVAHSSEAAIEALLAALETQPFDLLIVDDALPDADARTTLAHLDADFLLPPFLRVLLCPSGTPSPCTDQLAIHGFDAYLKKPVDRRQLRQILQETAQGRGQRAATSKRRLPEIVSPDRAALKGLVTPSIAPRPHDRPADNFSDDFPSVSTQVPNPSMAKSSMAKMLLVEDNEVNQFVAREVLRNLNYDVEIAPNGRVALECVRRARYDCILMDVQMPVMGGLEATRRIRQLAIETPDLAWCIDVPIVAMTAHNVENHREHCLNAGMDDWLAKPIEAPLLQATLQRWLSAYETGWPMADARPSPPSNSSATPAFSILPGIEIETGLQRMGGNWDDYRELLALFAETYSGFTIDK